MVKSEKFEIQNFNFGISHPNEPPFGSDRIQMNQLTPLNSPY